MKSTVSILSVFSVFVSLEAAAGGVAISCYDKDTTARPYLSFIFEIDNGDKPALLNPKAVAIKASHLPFYGAETNWEDLAVQGCEAATVEENNGEYSFSCANDGNRGLGSFTTISNHGLAFGTIKFPIGLSDTRSLPLAALVPPNKVIDFVCHLQAK